MGQGNQDVIYENNGLVIHHYVQRKTTVDCLKIIDALEPNEQYDLIFVVMQASQLPDVLPDVSPFALVDLISPSPKIIERAVETI